MRNEKENLPFIEAVRKIANDNNIPIEESEAAGTEEDRADARHRESMLAALDIIQKFFVDSILLT